MRKMRFTEAQTSWILEQAEGGARVDDLVRPPPTWVHG